MKIILIVVLQFAFLINVQSQAKIQNLGKLPERLRESSGLIIGNENTIWTHNDGDDSGYIYQLDKNLNIKRKVKIINSIDQDVEEITKDDTHFYINDMGNNANKRKNLRIYKISQEKAYSSDSVFADLIEFAYPDQDSFPPSKENMNFDCEAFFALDSSLYLFSKNRGKSTYSKIYKLPKTAGKYTAELGDSINTGHWVTSATISPNKSQIGILTSGIVYIISNFSNKKFSQGNISKFTIPYSQKEALTFKDENTLYITDERNDSTDGCLYEVNITDSIRNNLKFTNFYINYENSDSIAYYLYNGLNTTEVEISIKDKNEKVVFNTTQKTKVGRMLKLLYRLPKELYQISFKTKEYLETYKMKVQ